MSFRKEKKIRISNYESVLIKKKFFDSGMKKLYSSRIINSCYFDNNKMSCFLDSEEGVLPRKKIRIRWYNDILLFKKETKISSIEGRFKFTEKVDNIKSYDDLIKSNFFDTSYGYLTPKLIVTYERDYCTLNNMRITFDKNIKYKHIQSNFNQTIMDNECVVEIKTSTNVSDDYIMKFFSYQTSRFSKYSRGNLYFNQSL